MTAKRTHARWWCETPDGELVVEYDAAHQWRWALQEAGHARQRLIFRSSETFETS